MGRQGEKRRWAGGERQGANSDDEEGFLLISLPGKRSRGLSSSGKAYARDSSALFLDARGRPVATHCASSPRQLSRKWATASYCIADSYGRPLVLCIFAASDTYSNVSFRTKDPQEGALICPSLLAMQDS
jgi:hypothetical protein